MRQLPATGRPDGADGRPVWADVEVALQTALQRTNQRGQGSVRNVFDAMLALRHAGTGAQITIEKVGVWCTEYRGGPTVQSIRNNDRLADLIRIAMAVQAADTRPRGNRPIEHGLLEQVGQPDLRADLERLLAHRRMLIVENANLRAAMRRIKSISFLSKEMAEAKIETLEELEARIKSHRQEGGGPAFTAEEVGACRNLLNGGMAAGGLALDDSSGEIVDRHGRTIGGRGVASALRKVAGSKPN